MEASTSTCHSPNEERSMGWMEGDFSQHKNNSKLYIFFYVVECEEKFKKGEE